MGATAQYWVAVALCAALGGLACWRARVSSRSAATRIGHAIAALLLATAVAFLAQPVVDGDWTARSSLPLNLCDVALVIAAVTCAWPNWQLGVELTYFWGLAGTLQAVVTPDLAAGFPHLSFFVFVVGHVGIVVAALYVTVGLRRRPRRGAVPRVYAITAAYTALVGALDLATGGNYMFLRKPASASLLSILGPWPWYLVSAAAIAAALFLILDVPMKNHRSTAPDSDLVRRHQNSGQILVTPHQIKVRTIAPVAPRRAPRRR